MPRIPKSYDPRILAYLKKPKNLPLVLQIGDYAAKIKQDMPREFWSDVIKELNASRPNLKMISSIEFKTPTIVDLENELLNLPRSKSVTKNAHALFFDIEMYNSEDDFYVWIGAVWQTLEKKESRIYKVPEVVTLRSAMENDEDGYEFNPPYWLCGRYTWHESSRDKFLSECAEKKNQIVGTTVASYWRMVRRHLPQLLRANKVLQKFKN
jgi:hypothetical protein